MHAICPNRLLDGNDRVVSIMMSQCFFSGMHSHLNNMASHFFKKKYFFFLAGRENYSYKPSLRERVVSMDDVLFDRPACYLQINMG